MDRVLYTAEAVVEGGRAGHGRGADGRLDVAVLVPREPGGDGGPGTNPEQLFVVGYAACFESALLGVARGRAVAELYRGYGSNMVLRSADELAVHRDREASVIVLEYAVHGQAVQTGRTYDNRFVSVITIKDRKVTHWRDYLDPVAVFNALGWPAQ